jgi:ATP-binding protein involved in chromosome partitioning
MSGSMSESAVLEAVGAVTDPTLRASIGQLGILREVRQRWRSTVVELTMPVAGYPGREAIEAAVADAALRAGARGVEVVSSVMDQGGLEALVTVLVGAAPGPGEPRGHPFSSRLAATRILAISSGKGGVGKSSVTVNLAVALARRGHDVALLDADVYGFSVPKMLGITEAPLVLGDLLVPPVGHGVRCISMGFFVDEDQPVVWRGPMLHKALEQFLADVYWGAPEFLVIDLPPGTGDVALSIAQFLPRAELYVVTTPQPAAERVAQRSAIMARHVRMALRGVIENLTYFTGDDGRRYELFGAGGGAALSASLGVPLLAQIPLDPQLRAGGDDGRPVAVIEPDGEMAGCFDELAQRIVAAGPARVYRSELAIR